MRKWVGTIAMVGLCAGTATTAVGSLLKHTQLTNVGVGVIVVALLVFIGTLVRR